ncbi:MAG: glutaminyl-peptide cyclotransferase [Acidobacteria bacterium]|nr:glutaminyl-peptide cyclotransferase [Acidobacteriota bacterium]
MRQAVRIALVAFAFSTAGLSCRTENAPQATGTNPVSTNVANRAGKDEASNQPVPVYGFDVVNTFVHDSKAFTQGLIFQDGALLESTGQNGSSSLRRVELKTGKVIQKVDVPGQYFAEGMTLFNGRIYQLTWRNQKGFIYDPATFAKQGEFRYDGEGWGLTHDADSLILSDGTYQLRFLDPNTYEVKRTISVYDRSQPLRELNELEYVKGEIYANVWHDDRIARIDPQTGRILGWIDLAGLLPAGDVSNEEAVLNGIAYDETGDRLYVTGKLWPKIFEIRLKRK